MNQVAVNGVPTVVDIDEDPRPTSPSSPSAAAGTTSSTMTWSTGWPRRSRTCRMATRERSCSARRAATSAAEPISGPRRRESPPEATSSTSYPGFTGCRCRWWLLSVARLSVAGWGWCSPRTSGSPPRRRISWPISTAWGSTRASVCRCPCPGWSATNVPPRCSHRAAGRRGGGRRVGAVRPAGGAVGAGRHCLCPGQ